MSELSSSLPGFAALPRVRGVRTSLRLDAGRIATGGAAVAVAGLPLVVPRGPGNTSPVDAGILCALFLTVLWSAAVAHRWRLPYVLGAGLFMLGGAIGALVGPAHVAGILAVVQDIALFAWCWCIANLSRSAARLRVLLATWAYSAIGWAVLLFVALALNWSSVAGLRSNEGSRTALTFGDPNYSANYYVVSMMIIWATGRPRNRWLRWAAYGLLIAALASAGSNSGMVSLLVGVVVAAVLGLHRRGGLVPAVALMAAVALGAYVVASTGALDTARKRATTSSWAFIRDGLGRSEVSVAQRSELLTESYHLYSTGGLLGQGPVSTKVRLAAEQAPFVKEAHDDYFAALIERGVIGLFGLLLMLSSLTLRSAALAPCRLRREFADVVIRPNAIVAAVAGTLVAAMVYELLHVRHVWALFGIVAALYEWGRATGPEGRA